MTDPANRDFLYTMPPYDRMRYMEDDDADDDETSAVEAPAVPPFPDDPNDPCYGCGNWYGPCIWPCFRQMGYDKFPKRA